MLETWSQPQESSARPPSPVILTMPPAMRRVLHPRKEWNGVSGELLELHGPGRYEAKLEEHAPRLLVALEEVGGKLDVQINKTCLNSNCEKSAGPLYFVPGGMPAREHASLRYGRRILFAFDTEKVSAVLKTEGGLLSEFPARLRFSDNNVLQLATLLAAECTEPHSFGQIYGDGLAIALLMALSRQAMPTKQIARGGLAPYQLRRVTDYVEGKWDEPIRLSELAAITGLSQSQFGRMFKISTGTTPHQWHLSVRIRRAQELLIKRENSATDVALAAGFGDQSHFTRVFRQIVGVSPGAWQRQRAA